MECFRVNCHRLYIQSLLIAFLEALMIVGSLIAGRFLGRSLDAAYYYMYSLLFVLMIISSLLFNRLRTQPAQSSVLLCNLPLWHTVVLLIWSAGITLLDQRTYGHIIVYTVGLLVTAVLTYTPPKTLLIVYVPTHIVFIAMLPLFQSSSWIAAGHFANATIMAILAWFIGRTLYQAKYKDYVSFRELERLNRELEHLSYYDELTDIPNKRMFMGYIEEHWRRSMDEKQPLSLLFVDVDAFKEYNDLYGHLAGDGCLKKIAQTLSDCLSEPADFVSRYGGEEFTVLLPYTEIDRAQIVAQKICEDIAALGLLHEGEKAHGIITVSIGIASVIPSAGMNYMHFLAAADEALYRSKSDGRNTVSIAVSL